MPSLRDRLRQFLLDRDIQIARHPGFFTLWQYKLRAMKRRGLDLRCVIDGGAADGEWASELKAIFPDAQVVCVEPRANAQDNLRRLASELKGIHVAATLLGPREGDVPFNEFDVQSSVLPNSSGQSFGKSTTVPMTTLDALVQKLNVPWPDLIKLDLQGYELDALRGGEECMRRAQVLLLELSLYEFQQGAPLATDVMAFLVERGYRLYDVAGLWGRPLDGATAQGDFVFVRNGHPLVASNKWSADSEFA